MDCSTPGLPVNHQLVEFTQTHVHWVGDAIQPPHPLIPFSSCLQSFPAWGSFPLSQFFSSGGQSIGVSASAVVLPMNIQDWFPLGWTVFIKLNNSHCCVSLFFLGLGFVIFCGLIFLHLHSQVYSVCQKNFPSSMAYFLFLDYIFSFLWYIFTIIPV